MSTQAILLQRPGSSRVKRPTKRHMSPVSSASSSSTTDFEVSSREGGVFLFYLPCTVISCACHSSEEVHGCGTK